jgi:hypothetical protein
MTAGELAEHFDVSKPTMSGHFAVLREADLIDGNKRGAQLRINGVEHTVIGVVPTDFGFPQNHEIWTILRPELEPEAGLQVVGRMRTVQVVGAFPIDDVLTGRFVLESYDYETVEHRSSWPT